MSKVNFCLHNNKLSAIFDLCDGTTLIELLNVLGLLQLSKKKKSLSNKIYSVWCSVQDLKVNKNLLMSSSTLYYSVLVSTNFGYISALHAYTSWLYNIIIAIDQYTVYIILFLKQPQRSRGHNNMMCTALTNTIRLITIHCVCLSEVYSVCCVVRFN